MVARQTAPVQLDAVPKARRITPLRAIDGGRRDTAVERRSGGLSSSERESDGARVLDVEGHLDLATAVQLCARVDAVREACQSPLVVDLTRLQFCDSSGLRALIGAAEELLAGGGRVVIVPPVDDAAAQRFALAGAGELLPLRSSAAEALAALDATPG